MSTLITIVAVTAAYLIGAIPFGYCFALWVKGVDIRTVGSGNIGATNVGRTFGFRYFWLIFAVDLGKGLLPTWGFPLLVERLTGQASPPDLAVLVALASIMGHNFPVYLGFKGGKGVATSLGALLALDQTASIASAVGFSVFLIVTRYVSLSSMMGGVVFVLVHFLNVDHPFARENLAMTLLTSSLMVLLVVRHRANIGRIIAGTENKINLGKKREAERSGKIAARLMVLLAVGFACSLGGLFLWKKAHHVEILTFGSVNVREVARAGTGHQRAERVVFADGGRLIALTCPRYQHLVLYRVIGRDGLEPFHDIELEGQPVAVVASKNRLYVLQRPPGDNRHIAPGWVDAFDFQGQKLGSIGKVGFYPDDMVLSPDGKLAVIITSGRAEGGADRPKPALAVYAIPDRDAHINEVGHLEFSDPEDNPSRIAISETGRAAVVSLSGSDMVAAIDLGTPSEPRIVNRSPMPTGTHAYLSKTSDDAIIMPSLGSGDAVRVDLAGRGQALACALPLSSALEFRLLDPQISLGSLTLHGGTLNLGKVRPTGLAYSPELSLIAVANRSGGVHLLSLMEQPKTIATQPDQGTLKR